MLRSEAAAVKEVARSAAGGLTFHQLRHSYAAWLVSDGAPVNDVQKLMGHSRASTTADFYVHIRTTLDSRVNSLFTDDLLTDEDDDGGAGGPEPWYLPANLGCCWWAIQELTL
jgi:integrase